MIYQEMFKKDVAISLDTKLIPDHELLQTFKTYWHNNYQDTPQGIGRKVWAGIGFLVFGNLDYLEETLSIIINQPEVKTYKPCRYYINAIKKVLPMPDSLDYIQILGWLKLNKNHLQWDEMLGVYYANY